MKKLRKVKYRKWTEPQKVDGRFESGFWSENYDCNGFFHCWGCQYEDMEVNAGNYTVAIIENPDGSIEEIPPVHVKFIESYSFELNKISK